MAFDALLKLGTIFLFAAKKPDPEAPSSAVFGEYLWCSKREGMSGVQESDTELETQVFKDLRSHFATKKIRLPKETVKILQKCLKNNWYKKVFHPPPVEYLYRGLYFSSAQKLKDFCNLQELKDADEITYEKHKVFEPIDGYSSSWVFKKSITEDFSTNYGKAKTGYCVTLTAKVKDNTNNFLAGPGGLYDVEGMSKWHLEKETVGLEPINIYKLEYKKIG